MADVHSLYESCMILKDREIAKLKAEISELKTVNDILKRQLSEFQANHMKYLHYKRVQALSNYGYKASSHSDKDIIDSLPLCHCHLHSSSDGEECDC